MRDLGSAGISAGSFRRVTSFGNDIHYTLFTSGFVCGIISSYSFNVHQYFLIPFCVGCFYGVSTVSRKCRKDDDSIDNWLTKRSIWEHCDYISAIVKQGGGGLHILLGDNW